jgi:hypothetical protein
MAKTAADLLIERLVEWGVDTVFGFPGDGINGIFEALRTRQDQVKFIQVRHEEAAAFAACGYAKYTGRLGVCLATSGPGGVHLLNGLYDAKCDGQPVLAITGYTFHDLIGTNYQQDVDLDKLFADVAAYNERVMGPAHVHNVLDEAIKTALSRRTGAHITIPKDVQEWDARDVPRSSANIAKHSADLFVPPSPLPTQDLLRQAAELINSGSRVAILAGRGCLGAREEVLRLADKVAGPVIKPLLGKGVVPDDSTYATGGIGLLGTAPPRRTPCRRATRSSSPAAAFRTWSSTPSQAGPGASRSTSTPPASGCATRPMSASSATAGPSSKPSCQWSSPRRTGAFWRRPSRAWRSGRSSSAGGGPGRRNRSSPKWWPTTSTGSSPTTPL